MAQRVATHLMFAGEGSAALELDAAFAVLSAGGQVFMPLDNHGFSQRFGWCSDRFGVSWQLNLE